MRDPLYLIIRRIKRSRILRHESGQMVQMQATAVYRKHRLMCMTVVHQPHVGQSAGAVSKLRMTGACLAKILQTIKINYTVTTQFTVFKAEHHHFELHHSHQRSSLIFPVVTKHVIPVGNLFAFRLQQPLQVGGAVPWIAYARLIPINMNLWSVMQNQIYV